MGYGLSIWDMGYRYGIWYIDMVIFHIDMAILDVDRRHGLMIWEMTVSIRSSAISIWDILSLWAPRQAHVQVWARGAHGVAAQVEFETKV